MTEICVSTGFWTTISGKPQRRSYLSGPTTKASTPPPLELCGHPFFRNFVELQKKALFPQWSGFYPPPLSVPTTKKRLFLRLPQLDDKKNFAQTLMDDKTINKDDNKTTFCIQTSMRVRKCVCVSMCVREKDREQDWKLILFRNSAETWTGSLPVQA